MRIRTQSTIRLPTVAATTAAAGEFRRHGGATASFPLPSAAREPYFPGPLAAASTFGAAGAIPTPLGP